MTRNPRIGRRPRAANAQADPIGALFRITAWLALAAIALVWAFVLDDGNSMASLVKAALPNFLAVFVAYLIASYLLERNGISPEQRLRRGIVTDVAAEVRTVAEVAAVYDRIPDTPYGEMFEAAERIEMVGRWYNETLTRHPDQLAAFLRASRGNRLTVVVMDWTDPAAVQAAARQYSGFRDVTPTDRNEVIYKASGTAEVLRRLCQQVGSRHAKQVRTRVYTGEMNYWGMRFVLGDGRDLLYIAPYDNFRAQALGFPTVVFDLNQSSYIRDFWEREFASFEETSADLSEWLSEHALAQVDRALEKLDADVPPVLPGEWVEARAALQARGFELVRTEGPANRRRSRFHSEKWSHQCGSVQVQVEDDVKVRDAQWEPINVAPPAAAAVPLREVRSSE